MPVGTRDYKEITLQDCVGYSFKRAGQKADITGYIEVFDLCNWSCRQARL